MAFPDMTTSVCTSGAMPFNGASVSANGTLTINNGSEQVSALPNNVALPVGEGVGQEVMRNQITMPQLSNVSGEALFSDTLSPVPQPMEKLHSILPPPFLTKIYDLVEDVATNCTVSWSSGNNSFIVWNLSGFSQSLLPRYFKHNNFSSFVRQLSTYGFKKINPDRWEFAHEAFLRGQKHLLKDIHRRKPGTHMERQHELDYSNPGAVTPSPEQFVECVNFGLKEEIERLKRDKGVLAAEVARLQHQQQATEHKTRAMVKHVQLAEKRQELMMNFLAKAVRSPAFVAHLVQQSESRGVHYEARKRKHLPHGGDEVLTGLCVDPPAPIESIEAPISTVKEDVQDSYCDVEKNNRTVMYEPVRIDEPSNSETSEIGATSLGKVVKGTCGATTSVSLGLGIVPGDGNILLNYDIFRELKPFEESTADLALAFDMQEFLEELAPAVGEDVDTKSRTCNTSTSNFNMYHNELSQIISETDHSTEEQEVTSATDSYLSQNATLKDFLEVDCMMGTTEGF